MANVLIDSFFYVYSLIGGTERYDFDVFYDAVKDKFSLNVKLSSPSHPGARYRNYPIPTNLTTAQRGKSDNEEISFSCSGFNKISFQATLQTPFVKRVIIPNSEACGFIAPPPPPPPVPPPPPPVCDLAIITNSTPLTGLNTQDGSIAIELTTVNTGFAVVVLYKLANGTVSELVKNVVVDLSNATYTFLGLSSGDYRVYAYMLSFSCVATQDSTVAPMAFNEKYYFEYCEEFFDNRPIRIAIKKKNYVGASSEIKYGQSSLVKINYKSEGDYKFEPILGSSCTINLVTETEFQYTDLYIVEEQDTLIEIAIGGSLFWSGYLVGDQATESFDAAPYDITINALDGIKLLKSTKFELRDRYISFLEALKYILDKTNLSLPFKTMVDFQDKTLNVDYKLISGLTVTAYGNTVVMDAGVAVVNGVEYDLDSVTLVIPDLPAALYEKKYYILSAGAAAYLSTTFEPSLFQVVLIAEITQRATGLTIQKTRYWNGDVINDHLFNTNVFIKNETESLNCLEALEFICRQFTCKIKQVSGHWVFENDGSKARLNTTEFTYDNDLNFLSTETIDLSTDVDCSQGINEVLTGANISLITGDKQATVHWKLGYPKPIFGNWNFEQWFIKNGAEIPAQWQITEPYGWFNKGSKFDRIYDPLTGEVTEVENGSYYFNIKKIPVFTKPTSYQAFKTTNIAVFNQEVLTFSFQAIATDIIGFESSTVTVVLKPKIGNYICANKTAGKDTYDPIWKIDDGNSFFLIPITIANKPPFGDSANVTINLPPAPAEGLFNILFVVSLFSSRAGFADFDGTVFADFGFDNIKMSKTSPVTNVKTIEDATIIVENGNRFTNVPDDFEVIMGDVDTNLRTDGIRTLNHNITRAWSRIGLEETEALNNIICKELLSQYQQNTRMFSGTIFAKNLNPRNFFNLPLLDLYRFVVLSFDYDIVKCEATVTLAEVYAEDGASSGSIGGGVGGGANIIPKGYILSSKNNIFMDGNDNIFKSD